MPGILSLRRYLSIIWKDSITQVLGLTACSLREGVVSLCALLFYGNSNDS